MKKLLFRLILLALPFAVFVGAFEFRYWGKNNNQYVLKPRLLEAVASDVEILILGSSHGYQGMLPQIVGRRTFNLAATSQTLYYDVELALKYLPELPRLKTLVLPISYHSLETQLDQSSERWRSYYYYRFYSIPHRNRDKACDVRNFSLYFLYGRGAHKFRNYDATVDFDKWGGLRVKDSRRTAQELQDCASPTLRLHHQAMSPDNLPENIAALDRLGWQLRQRNVRLMLVTLPVTHYYRSGVQPVVYARMQQALEVFAKQNGLTYLNYWSDDRFTTDDFADADHLNRQGAVKFSQIIARELP